MGGVVEDLATPFLFLGLEKKEFRRSLYKWYKKNKRSHPWLSDRDPYKIWLYEIIMQQTKLSQGTPYFEKFIQEYPNVCKLSAAPIDRILKLWQGLGYYSRARNLHATANIICNDFSGIFPKSSKELVKLKGIGPYTAAAISTFAFDEKVDVVDGNVIRVLSRIFGVYDPIDETAGLNKIKELSSLCLDQKNPAKYNQAIMDFGATQCSPKKTNCSVCEMKRDCVALGAGDVAKLPLKAKKLIKKMRFFHFFVCRDNKGEMLIRQRQGKDIWKLLYEFPYEEESTTKAKTKKEIKDWLRKNLDYKKGFHVVQKSDVDKQELTHQTIRGIFYEIQLDARPKKLTGTYIMQKKKELKEAFAFPKIIDCYLN